jgi:hypothetical protein
MNTEKARRLFWEVPLCVVWRVVTRWWDLSESGVVEGPFKFKLQKIVC